MPFGFARSRIDPQISEAIYVYYGGGRRSGSFPNAVIERFGAGVGESLLAQVRIIQAEMFTRPPDWEQEDLLGAMKRVQGEVHKRHPELNKLAMKSLGNYFAFEWK